MKKENLVTDDLLKGATPRPWRISGKPHLASSVRIIQGGNEFFTVASATGFNIMEAKANAELITRAVNSFEAMREALKKVLKLEASTSNGQGLRDFSVTDLQDVYIATREALALAEGKAVQS